MKTIRIVILLAAAAATAQAVWAAPQFDHLKHKENTGSACTPCHQPGDASVVPDLGRCKECHKEGYAAELPGQETHGPAWVLRHGLPVKQKLYNCEACHEADFCSDCHHAGFADEEAARTVSVHRSDFHVTHPIAARADARQCEACHDKDFCVDCHETFNPADLAFSSHRRGWSDLRTSPSGPIHASFTDSQCATCHPDSVLPAHQWSANHAREARKNLATCQACHPDGDVCLHCHSARTGLMVNPHPEDWDDIKDRLKAASNGKTCRKCH